MKKKKKTGADSVCCGRVFSWLWLGIQGGRGEYLWLEGWKAGSLGGRKEGRKGERRFWGCWLGFTLGIRKEGKGKEKRKGI